MSGFQAVTTTHCRMSNLVLWMSMGRSMYFCATHFSGVAASVITGKIKSNRFSQKMPRPRDLAAGFTCLVHAHQSSVKAKPSVRACACHCLLLLCHCFTTACIPNIPPRHSCAQQQRAAGPSSPSAGGPVSPFRANHCAQVQQRRPLLPLLRGRLSAALYQ